MSNFKYIGDQGQSFTHPDGSGQVVTAQARVSPSDFDGVEFVFLFGPLQDPDRATPLGGLLRRAVSSGTVLIAAFQLGIDNPLAVALHEIIPDLGYGQIGQQRVWSFLPEFERYFELYGTTAAYLDHDPDQDSPITESIAWRSEYPPDLAAYVEVGQGGVYVLPYFVPGNENEFLPYLWEAVEAHRSGRPGRVPEFLRGLRLPGEQDVLDEIEEHERRVDELNSEAAHLRRFRLLLGRLSSQPLEDLVIETLNIVLARTGYEAQSRRRWRGLLDCSRRSGCCFCRSESPRYEHPTQRRFAGRRPSRPSGAPGCR